MVEYFKKTKKIQKKEKKKEAPTDAEINTIFEKGKEISNSKIMKESRKGKKKIKGLQKSYDEDDSYYNQRNLQMAQSLHNMTMKDISNEKPPNTAEYRSSKGPELSLEDKTAKEYKFEKGRKMRVAMRKRVEDKYGVRTVLANPNQGTPSEFRFKNKKQSDAFHALGKTDQEREHMYNKKLPKPEKAEAMNDYYLNKPPKWLMQSEIGDEDKGIQPKIKRLRKGTTLGPRPPFPEYY
jgi:hypothetical protein